MSRWRSGYNLDPQEKAERNVETMIVTDIKTSFRQQISFVADQTNRTSRAELRCVKVEGGLRSFPDVPSRLSRSGHLSCGYELKK